MNAIHTTGIQRQVIRPATEVAQTFKLTNVDRAISHMPVHNILAYRSGPSVEQWASALSSVLVQHPDYAGRIRRRGLSERIICRGQGILLETQHLDIDLGDLDLQTPEHASMLCATECQASEVTNGDEPLIRIRISFLRNGAQIFATCTIHSLTDGSGLGLFLSNLGRQLGGQPLLPVELVRPELPSALKDARRGLAKQRSFLLEKIGPLALDSLSRFKNSLIQAVRRRLHLEGPATPFTTVPVRIIEIDHSQVASLRQKHGLVLGHTLSAIVLKAFAQSHRARNKKRLLYVPVLDVRNRYFQENYSGNAVLMTVVIIPRDEIIEAPLQKLSLRLFADNMKAMNKASLLEYFSMTQFFGPSSFFGLIKQEAAIMIDNVSELSLARVDFGHGAPVMFFMPPPRDIVIPFMYIYQTLSQGLAFQIADPNGDLQDFADELDRLIKAESAHSQSTETEKVAI